MQRARIILSSAERLDVAEVAWRSGVSRPVVWRWQQRFVEAGVDGLLRDKGGLCRELQRGGGVNGVAA